MDPPASSAARRYRALGDWRVWLGLLVTVAALAWTLRGVDLREARDAAVRASPWLLLLTLPPHVVGLWLRALRWTHMTSSLSATPLAFGVHFRGVAIGYLVLNVLPLRLGELVRPWVLARETSVGFSAALGTIVVDRVVDFASLCVVAGITVSFHAAGLPDWVQAGARAMVVLGGLPLLGVVLIRLDRERALRWLGVALRPLPGRLREPASRLAADVAEGIAGLRSARDLAFVVLYSLLIWGVVLPAPMLLGLLAFDVDLPAGELLLAAFTVHVFIALAVAAPAAPGFFGVYHFACREALALFGVSPALAVAYGTLLHLGYWLTSSTLGIVAAGRTGTRLTDLTRMAGR